jgi:hypothetical protein
MMLIEWAHRWKVPPEALEELCRAALHVAAADDDATEGRVQSEVRLAAARQGKYLFRNNVGAGKLDNGSFVRWGLANESAAVNAKIKSADLIGIERVLITPEMVGSVIGRFLSVEVKRRDWKFSGTIKEMAQVTWASLINAQGGRAVITNNAESI